MYVLAAIIITITTTTIIIIIGFVFLYEKERLWFRLSVGDDITSN